MKRPDIAVAGAAGALVSAGISAPIAAGVEAGSAAEWVAAIGTVAAVGFAAWQYGRYERKGARSQAEKVAVYAHSYSYRADASGTSTEATAVVYNGSNLPIYRCSVRLLPWDWAQRSDPEPLDGCLFTVVRPNSETRPEQIDANLDYPPWETPGRELHPPYEIEFDDLAGRRWIRRPDGELREVARR